MHRQRIPCGPLTIIHYFGVFPEVAILVTFGCHLKIERKKEREEGGKKGLESSANSSDDEISFFLFFFNHLCFEEID